jgi:hypothetical protein
VFLDFQQYIKRQFGRKILTMQTDWGGEYEKLNSFFNVLVLFITFPVHMLISKMVQLNVNTDIL